jgi:hypothetical protein
MVNCYEHPTTMKRRTVLPTLGDVFPHSTSRGTARLEHDHPRPYDPDGPPDHPARPVPPGHPQGTRKFDPIRTDDGRVIGEVYCGGPRIDYHPRASSR